MTTADSNTMTVIINEKLAGAWVIVAPGVAKKVWHVIQGREREYVHILWDDSTASQHKVGDVVEVLLT